MKKTKLVLKRLTVGNLSTGRLSQVAGGGPPSQRADGCSYTCHTCTSCTVVNWGCNCDVTE